MKIEERYSSVLNVLENKMGKVGSELNFSSPFQLLVAVMLSAQCTDKRVNAVTPELFARYPDARSLADAVFEDVFELIRSVSYPNSKGRHIIDMARMLVSDFDAEVPSEPDELVKLPGVGRKTANVILSVIFEKAAMAVDTHVFRVSNRIGLTKDSPGPLVTEKTLVKHIPEHLLGKAHHWLILHGRYVCTARAPKCMECGIRTYCKYYEQATKGKKA